MSASCPKCGAGAPDDVLSGVVRCPFCGTTFDVGAAAAAAPPPVAGPYGAPPPAVGPYGAAPPVMGPYGMAPPPMGPVVLRPASSGRGVVLGFMLFIFGLVALILVGTGVYVFAILRSVNETVTSATAGVGGGSVVAGPSSGPDSVCERAYRCCHAYMQAVGSTSTAGCESMRTAGATPIGSSACQSSMQGWRSGLSAMSKTIPADCQ